MNTEDLASFRQQHLVRNVAMIATDGALFGAGVALVGVHTLVPAVLVRLGASNAVIGMLPALLTLGTTIGPLFTAYLVTGKRTTKRYSLTAGLGQRLPWLVAGVVLFFAGRTLPDLTVTVILAAVVVFGLSNGFVGPVWFDIVARAIPSSMRGRMFAVRDAVGQGLTLASGAFVAWVLEILPFPTGHASLLLIGFGVFAVSWICFFSMVEVPQESPVERTPFPVFLRRFAEILRGNPRFRRFVIARGLFTVAESSAPFVTVFVLDRFGLADRYVGFFAITTAASVIVFTQLYGQLGDRRGHRTNFVIASSALVVAGALALGMEGLWMGFAMFVAYGAARSARTVSAFNLTAEFAGANEVSLYIAIAAVITAPLSLASILLGVLADAYGYEWVFVVAALLAVGALSLFVSIGRRRRGGHKKGPAFRRARDGA
ncbi:MAG: MFS transporter [Spirochaetota bacterium]